MTRSELHFQKLSLAKCGEHKLEGMILDAERLVLIKSWDSGSLNIVGSCGMEISGYIMYTVFT